MHRKDAMLKMATQVVILRAGSSLAATLARLKNTTRVVFSNILVHRVGMLTKIMRTYYRITGLWLTLCMATSIAIADDDMRIFHEGVAPLLERRCIGCHGPQMAEGGLSFETHDTLLAGGDSGPPVVPGDPDSSLLLEYVTGDDPAMPAEGDPLAPEEIAVLRAWIAANAPWPRDHRLEDPRFSETWWSLQPLEAPPIPEADSSWGHNPIDAFVLAKLREQGLEPSPLADRRTLIRRVKYDLHGLPPSPEEVAKFMADNQPSAYARLVDRLLESPRYGERWARHWLDVVHFGESHGYDKDKPRPHAWPYRDYVIRSLNSDKPYGRFIKEQIAGDVLYPDDPQAIVATGFIAAGPWDFVGQVELREGTVDKKLCRSLDRDDMVAATMSTFTSMTVHCARCHDHRFDPIQQEEYYRLQAVFAGVERANRPYDEDPSVHRRRRVLQGETTRLQGEHDQLMARRAANGDGQVESWTGQLAELQSQWENLPKDSSPTNGYHSGIEDVPDVEKWVQVDLGKSHAIQQVRLVPARPPDFRDAPGFGFPARYRVEVAGDEEPRNWKTITDHTASDVPNPGDTVVEHEFDALDARYVRIVATRLWERDADYVFALGELQVTAGGQNVARQAEVSSLDAVETGRWSRAALIDGYSSRALLAGSDESMQREKLKAEIDALTARIAERLDALMDPQDAARLRQVEQRLRQLEADIAALPEPSLVYAAANAFKPSGNFTPPPGIRPIHLLHRGSVQSPGELMPPGTLACVPGLEPVFELESPEDEGSRRAALADWLASDHNVLTWRSIVNRVWHYHFGVGLADTPSDFGRMGGPPSHPELLDWLAAWFRDSDGSLKQLHRLIVTSATYRQASAANPRALQVDSANRLLWRSPRRRLEAESVRDAVLVCAGRLDETMGGPSVQQFLFEDDHSPRYDYLGFDVDHPSMNRRSIYRFLVRSVQDPFMERLDCPDPSLLTPRRNQTLTAIQALALLNNHFVVRQAEHFATRVESMSQEPGEQIDAVWRIALARPLSADEQRLASEFLARRGLPALCRLVFNMNEFLFVD